MHLAHAKHGELVGVGAAAAACLRPHARQPLPPRLGERAVRGRPQGPAVQVSRDRQLGAAHEPEGAASGAGAPAVQESALLDL